MEPISNNPINISRGNNGGYIQNELEKKLKDIIYNIREKADVEFSDEVYRELYIKMVQFAKEIDEILSYAIQQPDNVFTSNPDINSFKNQKL